MSLPDVVSQAEWQAAHEELLAREKEATRASDALAAERRRQPLAEIEKDYVFEGTDGEASLLDLFEGRSQLILYHFMFAPGVNGWPDAGCPGCSMFVDQVGHLAHFHARDTSFALVSLAPLERIEAYRRRMGWEIPWFSSAGSDFNRRTSASRPTAGETFGLSVFLRDGERRLPHAISRRRAASRRSAVSGRFLDLTPLGRQEEWEDTPPRAGHRRRRTSGGAATTSTD